MLFNQITTSPGEVTSIGLKCDYVSEPTITFERLTQNNKYSLLLESAEIDSKDELKSIMLIDTAVVFECYGLEVNAKAQNENGQAVISHMRKVFNSSPYKESVTVKTNNASKDSEFDALTVVFKKQDSDLDEEQRLVQINAFEVLRAVINQIKHNEKEPYALFLGGVFAYDMLANFEQLPDVPNGVNNTPDYAFYLAETLMVIDHKKRTTELVGNVFSGESVYQNCFAVGKRLEQIQHILSEDISRDVSADQQSLGKQKSIDFDLAKPDVSDSQFKEQVSKLKNNIIQGDVFQVVPSRGFTLPCENAIAAYKELKSDNPSPYMFYLRHPEFELFGASPESALKYEANTKQVEVYPIAGTRKRGFNPDGSINKDLDSRIELDLRNDHKEVSEHTMLVDLARNDIARISETGSRYVKDLLKVDRYSYVMHLVSRVVGTLRGELDALHAYQACMNMGTLVGAPKIKAAALIRDVEQTRRGSYGGAVGYLNGRGDMDTCIVIRSAYVSNGQAYVQAGAGVVFDSDPQSEVEETSNKARAVIKAVLRAGV